MAHDVPPAARGEGLELQRKSSQYQQYLRDFRFRFAMDQPVAAHERPGPAPSEARAAPCHPWQRGIRPSVASTFLFANLVLGDSRIDWQNQRPTRGWPTLALHGSVGIP